MSGNATPRVSFTSGFLLFSRITMAGFLFVYCIGQLITFWQAAQIIGPGAFPVLLINAAVPLMFFIGAVLLAIGFKTRFAAIAMVVLLAGTSLFALAMSGSLGNGALNVWGRLAIIFLLGQPIVFGAGRWSIDGLLAARVAARAAQ